MIHNTCGQIFIYNNLTNAENSLIDIVNNHTCPIFATDNIYQFLRYAKEIAPQVMILNLQNAQKANLPEAEYFRQQINPRQYPIIVLKPQNESFILHQNIAHYLHMPNDLPRLQEIIDTYSIGYKKHQILLLDSYSSQLGNLHQQIIDRGYTFFEVHNGHAANLYLQKNQPQIVCVEYSPAFITARHMLQHNRIFYVDRQQDIAEIEKFLN